MSNVDFDFWVFIAGLGIFLFGMYHLENGLKGLAGNSLKKVLQRFTNRSWKGILTGAVVTAVLQSSSLVNLLVVAFLGGGIITLQNSLGVVFGANLGTTATAWLVATLGFKVDIADFSLPFLAIGTLSYLLMDSRPVLKHLGGFLIGFGLLFLGLDYMKIAVAGIAEQIDLSRYAGLGLWVFLLIGIIVTALIQSSSAMIVIVLSALNAELVDIYQAVAMVIGANIGTSSTLILASLKGSADKKRLALANVVFNLTAGAVTFLLLRQLVHATIYYLDIREPLMELVLLNTAINLIGILLFFPFLKPLGRFMRNRFKKSEPKGECIYIRNVTPQVADVAIKALDKELTHIFVLTQDFILSGLKVQEKDSRKSTSFWRGIIALKTDMLDKYQKLKKMEDEVTDFYTQIQEHILSEAEADLVALYMLKLRSLIYAAKNIKDVLQNIRTIDESDDQVAREVLSRLQAFASKKLQELADYASNGEDILHAEAWNKDLEQFYNETLNYFYKNIHTNQQKSVPASTMTNVIKKVVASVEELSLSVANKEIEAQTMRVVSPIR